jgi:hypothetical protein
MNPRSRQSRAGETARGNAAWICHSHRVNRLVLEWLPKRQYKSVADFITNFQYLGTGGKSSVHFVQPGLESLSRFARHRKDTRRGWEYCSETRLHPLLSMQLAIVSETGQ